MTKIEVYDNTAKALEELAEMNDTTLAEILEEIICDHGEEYEV